MPPKQKKATVPGLASRAAMAAAKKRGTVSAAVAATSTTTSPAADSPPAASESLTPSSRVSRVIASLSNAASTAVTSISPSRMTRQTVAMSLQTPIPPTPSVESIAHANNNESAERAENNNNNNDLSDSDSDYSINKSNNANVNDDDDDKEDDEDADVKNVDDNLSHHGGHETGGASNDVDFENMFNDDASVENNDYAAQEYDFMDRLWHWFAPATHITDKNRRAVESVLLIQAGIIVEESATTDENRLHELMYSTYQSLLRDIPNDRYENELMRDTMTLNYKGGKEPVCNGKSLWRQQKEVRKNVRNLAAEMPGAANFNLMPSGTGLRDAWQKLIVKKYTTRTKKAKQYDDDDDAWEHIPPTWWLEHHSCVFLLALMVHRRSAAITPAAAMAQAGPTRIELRNNASAVLMSERKAASEKRKATTDDSSALERVYKTARVEGMKGIAIKHRIDAAEMKLRMMNQNREYYVAAATNTEEGVVELNKKIKAVIDLLPDSFDDLTGREKPSE